jgi:hypothetical protein
MPLPFAFRAKGDIMKLEDVLMPKHIGSATSAFAVYERLVLPVDQVRRRAVRLSVYGCALFIHPLRLMKTSFLPNQSDHLSEGQTRAQSCVAT